MECLYDTEEIEDLPSAEDMPDGVENDTSQSVFQEIPVAGQTTVYVASEDGTPKTFDQLGFEVATIFFIGVLVGLLLWKELSKRWHA